MILKQFFALKSRKKAFSQQFFNFFSVHKKSVIETRVFVCCSRGESMVSNNFPKLAFFFQLWTAKRGFQSLVLSSFSKTSSSNFREVTTFRCLYCSHLKIEIEKQIINSSINSIFTFRRRTRGWAISDRSFARYRGGQTKSRSSPTRGASGICRLRNASDS